jgi:hypothetical protein
VNNRQNKEKTMQRLMTWAALAAIWGTAGAQPNAEPAQVALQRVSPRATAGDAIPAAKCYLNNQLGRAIRRADGKFVVAKRLSQHAHAIKSGAHPSTHPNGTTTYCHGATPNHNVTQRISLGSSTKEATAAPGALGARVLRLDAAQMKTTMATHHSVCDAGPFVADQYEFFAFHGNTDRVNPERIAASTPLPLAASEVADEQLQFAAPRPAGSQSRRWLFVVRAASQDHQYQSPQLWCTLTE